jgi:hypothetical protein
MTGPVCRRKYEKPCVKRPYAELVSRWLKPEKRFWIDEVMEESDDPELIAIAKKLLAKKTTRVDSGKTIVYVRWVSQEELDIIKFVSENGVRTEIPFTFKLVTLGKSDCILAPMGFLNAGETLAMRFKKIREELAPEEARENMREIFASSAEMIGRIESMRIYHRHPHFENIYWDAGHLRMGDFSLVRRIDVDFRSADEIIDRFTEWDYYHMMRNARKILDDLELWHDFFGRLIRQYPISGRILEELDHKMKKQLNEYWERKRGIW